MDNLALRRLSTPIVTGAPQVGASRPTQQQSGENQGPSFQEVLRQQLDSSAGLTFSKHAAARVNQRQVELSPASMERLHEGVRLAEQKGLRDTLILVDQTAFIVNVPNNTVITTVASGELQGNVFTNIDGTVII